jgi:crossover junction endodeoxyribonuclease RusA
MEARPLSGGSKSGTSDDVGSDSNPPKIVITTSRLVLKNIRPVSVNMMYRTYRGRVILSKRGREFKNEVGAAIEEMKLNKVLGDIELTIIFSFGDRRRRDIDNYGKAIIDCVKGVMFEDDSAIMRLVMIKKLGARETSMDIVASSIGKL